MAEMETHDCHYCEGTGITLGGWDREPCERCEGTGQCPVCWDLAELGLLDVDVED